MLLSPASPTELSIYVASQSDATLPPAPARPLLWKILWAAAEEKVSLLRVSFPCRLLAHQIPHGELGAHQAQSTFPLESSG
jgi:hypothetical protein